MYFVLGYTYMSIFVHTLLAILLLNFPQQNTSNWWTKTIPYCAWLPDFLLVLHLSEPGYYYYLPWGFEDLFIYFCLLIIFFPHNKFKYSFGGLNFWCTKHWISTQSSLTLCARKIPVNFSGIFAWLRAKDFKIPSCSLRKHQVKCLLQLC